MPVITVEEIKVKRSKIGQEIAKLEGSLEEKRMELRELQNNCHHSELVKIRSLRNNVDYCEDCGFEERFKDMDDT